MKKRIKDIFIGLIIGTLITSTPVFAESLLTKIDVVLNGINVQLEGKDVAVDSILYNGTTYLPMRKVTELVEKDIEWNQETMTANIVDKTTIPKTDNDIKDGEKLNVDVTEDLSYEDFIKMFDLKFETNDGINTKIKHYIYNGSLSYKDLKNKISSYDDEKLIEFSKYAIENSFEEDSPQNNYKLILCFNYTYYESMSGKDTLFQAVKNRNEENIGKVEIYLNE